MLTDESITVSVTVAAAPPDHHPRGVNDSTSSPHLDRYAYHTLLKMYSNSTPITLRVWNILFLPCFVLLLITYRCRYVICAACFCVPSLRCLDTLKKTPTEAGAGKVSSTYSLIMKRKGITLSRPKFTKRNLYIKQNLQKLFMDKKIFAFDLGSSSLGWAVVDGDQIQDAGVRIFPEGVENLGQGEGKEQPLNGARREARQSRRQFFRKRFRKRFLLKALARLKMAPVSESDLRQSHTKLLAQPEMQRWTKLNPYDLRKRALKEDLTRLELGRILYHFIQRRGFQSNSRQALQSEDGAIFEGNPKEGKVGIQETEQQIDAAQSTLGGFLQSIYPKEGQSYQDQSARIRNRYTTRKMYINEFEKIWDRQAPALGLDSSQFEVKHVRLLRGDVQNKRNQRSLRLLEQAGKSYQLEEVELSPSRKGKAPQQAHRLVTEEEVDLKTLFGDPRDGRLFYQRPLRSQKGRIGKCTFERQKFRTPNSHPLSDYVRVYEFVNTIQDREQKLSKEQREKAARFLLQVKPSKKGSIQAPKFQKLAKAIGLEIEKNGKNILIKSNYAHNHTCPIGATVSRLADENVFGDQWFEFSDAEQEDIWHALYFFDDIGKLEAYAQNPRNNQGNPKLLSDGTNRKWKLSADAAKKFARISLKQGYDSLSQKAMRYILDFLKEGHVYSHAIALGGVRKAFGEKKWDALSQERRRRSFICDNVLSIVSNKDTGSYLEPLKEYLKTDCGLEESALQLLYHHSDQRIKQLEKLPTVKDDKDADQKIQSIRNPVVITVLFELRKLVNKLISTYERPARIKIELARDLKLNREQRESTRIRQKKQEKERQEAIGKLHEIGQPESEGNILHYRLWKEAGGQCVYTGNQISLSDLFSEQVQIDHIHPYSRSFDNSFKNKVVCLTEANRDKSNQTPYEWKSKEPVGWDIFKKRALEMFKSSPDRYRKYKQLVAEELDDNFASRQIVDTAYATTRAVEYLKCICSKVEAIPGRATAQMRKSWGVNSILYQLDKDTEYLKQVENELKEEFDRRKGEIFAKKNRADHRHHALDAIVLAFTTAGHVQRLSELSSDSKDNEKRPILKIEFPTKDFHRQAKEAVNQILISYKPPRRNKHVISKGKSKSKKSGETYYTEVISVRGQLHKETVYGRHGDEVYHVRKPLESLTKEKQVNKIVDPRVRALVDRAIQDAGGYDEKGNIPKGAFFFESEKDAEGKSLNELSKPKVSLPNKNGDKVPVRKVRLKESINNAVQLKASFNQFVNPRNNHHAIIYKNAAGELKQEVFSFWEIVKRVQQGGRTFELPKDGVEEIVYLQKNDMFLLGLPEDLHGCTDKSTLSSYLYTVQKLSGIKDGAFEFTFRKHIDARPSTEAQKDYVNIKSIKKWEELHPIKVEIDVLGKIRWL